MNRDFIIERLERKLIEKEKEVEELRKMLEGSGTEKIVEIETTVTELRKAIESILSEIAYIKSELKELREKIEPGSVAAKVRKFDEKFETQKTSEIIESFEDVEVAKCEEQSGEDDEDLIICD